MQYITQKRGYRWLPLLALAVAVALLVLAARGGEAVHNEGLLELDGDQEFQAGQGVDPGPSPCPPGTANPVDCIGSATAASFDWEDSDPSNIAGEQGLCRRSPGGAGLPAAGYITETSPPPSPSAGTLNDVECGADFVQGQTNDLSYHTGSDKDFQEITTAGTDDWACRTSANATSKADLLNAGFVLATDANGDQIVYFMAERDTETGDVFNGFWVLANAITIPGAGNPIDCSTAPTPKNFSGVHKCGDVLIRFNYESGGRVSSAFANRWDDSTLVADPGGGAHTIGCDGVDGTGDECLNAARTNAQSHGTPTGVLCIVASTGTDCRAAITGDTFCGRVNGPLTCKKAGCDALTLGPGEFSTPWEPNDGSPAANVVKVPTFSEIGINLTAFKLDLACVSAFMAETRSSSSIDATLKDFALAPTGSECGAGLTTAVHNAAHGTVTAVAAGTAVHDSATLTVSGPSGVTAGGSLSVQRFNTIDCTGTAAASATVPVSQAPGSQTYDNLLGTTTASGTSISYLVSYSGDPPLFAPATFGCEPLQVVDAKISIGTSAVNEVGVCHTFTVNVQQNDGLAANATGGDATTGFQGKSGLNPTVTFTDANGAVNTACGTAAQNTCASTGTDASGNCTASIKSSTAGTVTAHAAVTFSVGGVSLTRATDGTGNNSGDAVKRFVDAKISIGNSAVNEVGVCHTFTVNVQQDDGLAANAPGGDATSGFQGKAGLNPTVTFTNANGAVNTACGTAAQNTCASVGGTDASGNCTASIKSNTTGTVTAHATVTFSVGGVSLTRATDGTGNNSGDAVKRFVDAKISIGNSAVNEVGVCHTFTVNVQQDDGLAANAPGGDATTGFAGKSGLNPTVTFTDANGAVNTACGTAAQNTCASVGGTDASGNCTASIKSNTAGTVTAHATVTFSVGGVSLTRATDGTGNNSSDAVKRFVDAQIDLSPLSDTNPINDVHEITATVLQDDGLPAGAPGDSATGFGPAPNSTCVVFTFSQNTIGATFTGPDDGNSCGGTSSTLDDCRTGVDGAVPTAGQCPIHITSSAAGTVKVHATTTFSVGGVSLTRQTDGLGNNSGDAQKIFESAAIMILKRSTKTTSLGNLPKLVTNPGALFAVDGPDAGPEADFEVRDNDVLSGVPTVGQPGNAIPDVSDADPTVGEICISGLVPGSYTVTEIAPPPGYALPPVADQTDTAAAVAPSNCSDNQPAPGDRAIFVDPPLFDIQIRFRDGGSTETFLVDQDPGPGVTLISCTNVSTGTPSTADTTAWDDTLTVTGIQLAAPQVTVQCTLVVDP